MFLRPTCAPASSPLSWFSRFHSARMPLRAKILNPNFLPRQVVGMSTKPFDLNSITEEPGDDPNDVLFGSHYGVRTIELNRPPKLNSLNGSMARKIILRLKEWEQSELANIIIIGGSPFSAKEVPVPVPVPGTTSSADSAHEPKRVLQQAFCAGGDVVAIVRNNASGPDGQTSSKDYFALEYRLDHLIATYTKPYVAYMDGITMGGGVGLSVHAPFRIATERTVFSMPETSIGFFPDIGASFFLPRLDGYIGTYLALTSNQLDGVNAFYTGIATHYIDSSSLPGLTARLGELEFKDYHTPRVRNSIIDATIQEFGTGIPHDKRMVIAGELRRAIDRCFRHNRMEDILSALESERTSRVGEWASKTIETLLQRSPTSLKVTLKQMRLGRRWSISEAFQREYSMASKFMTTPDFANGVSARLIEKPPIQPIWNPSKVDEVQDTAVDHYFRVEGEERLMLLREGTYTEYPVHMGLPTESEVKKAMEDGLETGQNAYSLRRMVKHKMLKDMNGKVGVREKVAEVLQRKCGVDDKGRLIWKDDL